VEEYSHAGLPAFRVGGRKFASLARKQGVRNLMLTLEQRRVLEEAEIFCRFLAAGKDGHTHLRLARRARLLTGASERRGDCELIRTQRQAKKPHVAERSGVTR